MNSIKNWDHPIKQNDFIQFLNYNKWTNIPLNNDHILVYRSPSESHEFDFIKIVVPKNEQDFDNDCQRLLNTVSNYFDTSIPDLKISILNQASDISLDRILDSNKGSISLELANSVISSLYENTKKAATLEKHKLLLNSNKAYKAPNILKNIQFGHTFQGSFGFSLILPLPTSFQPSIEMDMQEPYERLVLKRIHNSYKIIDLAVKNRSIDPFIDDIENAPTPSMCDEYRKIFTKNSAPKIEHIARWSPLYRTSNTSQQSTTIITSESVEYLAKASSALRKESVPIKATVFGKVPDLHKDFHQSDHRMHYITILWEPTVNKLVHVKVELDHDTYQKALQAHEKELIVAVDGQLKKGAPFYQLLNPYNFRIL